MSSVLYRGKLNLLHGIIKPLQINPTRNALTNHYINKKQRMIKFDRSTKNLEWAKYLQEYEQSEENKEPSEPHMIHLLTLNKSLKSRPWWEKDILRHFGFDSKNPKKDEQVLVKNTLKVNKLLQEVLHMVTIQPFKLPLNLPTNLSNTTHLVLRSNGKMVMGQVEVVNNQSSQEDSLLKIESISASDKIDSNSNANSSDKPSKNNLSNTETSNTTPTSKKLGVFKLFSNESKWDLSKEVVQKELDRVVQLNKVNMDQFPTHYEYKNNQDGKMFRYNFNKSLVIKK